LAHLRELEAELEQRLAAKDEAVEAADSSAAHAADAPPPSSQPQQPIRKLDAGPLEAPAQQQSPKPQKKFGGDYYPTETHVKREES